MNLRVTINPQYCYFRNLLLIQELATNGGVVKKREANNNNNKKKMKTKSLIEIFPTFEFSDFTWTCVWVTHSVN